MTIFKNFIKECQENFEDLDFSEKLMLVMFFVLLSSCVIHKVYTDYYTNDDKIEQNQMNEFVIENEVNGVKQTIIISGENLSIVKE